MNVTADRVFRSAAWAAVVCGTILFLTNAVDLVRLDVPGDYVEGVVLLAQHDTAAGRSLYAPTGWQTSPYRINLYGPVFYRLGGWALALGSNPASLRPGRILSILALALALAGAWRLARGSLGVTRSAAAMGLMISLGFLPVLVFAPQNRVDTLAVAISLAGILLGLKHERWGPAVAGLVFVAGVFTKPTAIAAAGALFLWFAWQKRWRDAATLAGTCVVAGSACLAVMSFLTQGGFTTALFRFNANPYAVGGLIKALQQTFAAPVLPLVAGLALVLVITGSASERLLSGYFLISLALAVATVGKIGANLNYFLEPGLAMAPLAALAWNRWHREITGTALMAVITITGLLYTAPRVASELAGRRQRQAVERLLTPILAGKRVLTMEVGTALAAGAIPVLNDPHIFARLAEVGRWDESPLVAELQSGQVDVVLADADMLEPAPAFSNFTAAVRGAITQRYRLEKRLGPNLWLYLPKEVVR